MHALLNHGIEHLDNELLLGAGYMPHLLEKGSEKGSDLFFFRRSNCNSRDFI